MHKLSSFYLFLFFSSFTLAAPPTGDLAWAPAKFASNGKQAVFVDIQRAEYRLRFRVPQKIAEAQSRVEFQQLEAGHPLFDLVPEATRVMIDGHPGNLSSVTSPDGKSTFKMLDLSLAPGAHVLEVDNPVHTDLRFGDFKVAFAYIFSDLAEREFLEQHLLTNMEFDRYPSTLEVEVLGTGVGEHELFTNGAAQKLGINRWRVEFPPYFNSSAPLLHVAGPGTFVHTEFEYASVDGRRIPVQIFTQVAMGSTKILEDHANKTRRTLAELERDYGPFLHPRVVIHANENFGGGMEYAGATISDLWALDHELTHSYFARGMMPANGNSGWMDEAIASWRDNHYPRGRSLDVRSDMGAHSPYSRGTDGRAYTQGMRFISHLDQLFAAKGGLKAFFRTIFPERALRPIFTQDFQSWAETALGRSLAHEFNEAIYGTNGSTPPPSTERSPYHRKLTPEERASLL